MTGQTILVTGGAGQVGLELLRQPWPAEVSVLAPGRDQLDLASAESIAAWFAGRQIDDGKSCVTDGDVLVAPGPS